MWRTLFLLSASLLAGGCAAVAPLGSLISVPRGTGSPVQAYDQTSVNLADDDFVLVKTNAYGRSRGFSLLGIITIVPASMTTAYNRMYASAEMAEGKPQTTAHLLIQQTSSYYILFGIPKVEVRADIVQFRPGSAKQVRPKPPEKPLPTPP
jgi:hypothetical protein